MANKKSINVVVFSQPECPACDWVMAFLRDRAIEFEVRDITTDPEAFEHLTAQYRSQSTPTIVVNEKVLVGFDPEALEALLAHG